MKKIATLVLVIASAAAFGQNVDQILKQKAGEVLGDFVAGNQAHQERNDLGKAETAYNAAQEPIKLRGLPVINRSAEGSYIQPELQAELRNIETGLGIPSAWDVDDIRRESEGRRYLRGESEVNQSTVPDKGTIDAGGDGYFAELGVVEVEKSTYFQAFFGARFTAGLNFSINKRSAYCALTYTLRSHQTGLAVRCFKVIGVASTADNVGGNIANRVFGGQFSFGDSGGDLQFRARQNALKRLAAVLSAKAL